MQDLFLRFLTDRSGTTAIEYALIACGIAVAIVGAVGQLGQTVGAKYQSISTSLK